MRLQAKKWFPSHSFSFSYKAKADQKLLTSDSLREEMSRVRSEAYLQGTKGSVMDLKLYTDDWNFKVKDITIPVYLWYGDADKNVSLEMGKYYKKQIPSSKLTIYPKEGHFVIRNHCEEILEALI